jgi:hypothetical protein
MPGERMYPILPCPDIDEAIGFYEAIGFTRTYRQVRPNPSAVVARDDMHIHLAGIDGFDPEQSYASVIIVVPDPDVLYRSFAAGLRNLYGRLPVAGSPRMTRPRKRYGTVDGFSLIDVGGNWLRFYKTGDTEETTEHAESGLPRIVEVSARLGDAKGDVEGALKTLESGLQRHADAPGPDRARALLYRAELAIRLDKAEIARQSLAELDQIELDQEQRSLIAEEREHVDRLVAEA